jgi:cyclophilin family peptidyl-prolyl cis-trans isomerase
VGTAKRERKKMNREMGRQEAARAESRRKTTRRTVRIVVGVVVLLGFIFGVSLLVGGDDETATIPPLDTSSAVTVTPESTTTVAPGEFVYGTGECAPTDGSAEQRQSFSDAPQLCIDPTKTYTAVVVTNLGEYTIELDAARAPGTVNNFVNLARFKYYDGNKCHRAIPGFMVQCGDPTGSGSGNPGYSFADELPAVGEYEIGSVAMANSGPNTNGSQFFVITGEQGVTLPPSYSLFGTVIDGLDTTVVDMDAAGNPDPATNGVPPLQDIIIESITVTES